MDNQTVYQRSNKGTRLVSGFLIIASCFLFVFSFAACGRRGDPVPIAPYDKNIVPEDTEKEPLPVAEEKVEPESGAPMSDVPAGLMALYTQKAVILTWDEVRGRDVSLYKVYRSSGDGYAFIGDTAVPAFTDLEVRPNTKYYYKVTAAGVLESQPSKEIVIVTEVH